jgi:hypothetical protein
VLGVNPANLQPARSGQQSLQLLLAPTGTYTLLDNHELGNRSLQSGGAPPGAPQGSTDPIFDVNRTGSYNNKTLAFQTIEKSYLDYHPTRFFIIGSPATGYTLAGPHVTAPAIRAATARRSSISRSDGAPTASISRLMAAAIATFAFPSSAATAPSTISDHGRTTPIARC